MMDAENGDQCKSIVLERRNFSHLFLMMHFFFEK